MKNFNHPSLLLFLFLLLSQRLSAQDDLFEMDLEQLMNIEVVGVSKYKEGAQKAPATVFVITETQIQKRGYMYLNDVLRDLPGIDIVQNAGRFGEFYSIRGIQGNDRFLVLIDGHKINPASGTFLSVGNSIPVSQAEQIEIVYGSASAVYGADAFAGIINIITKVPSESTTIQANAQYGSFNTISSNVFVSKKLTENFSFTAFGNVFQSDGYDYTETSDVFSIISQYPEGKTYEQPENDYNILLKTTYKNFTLGYFRQAFNEGNAHSMNPAIYVYSKENIWKFNTDLVWGSYQKNIGENGTLTTDFSYISHIQDNETMFYKWSIPNNPTNTFSQYMTGIDRTGKFGVNYSHNFSEKIKMICGIDYEYTNSIPPYANDEVLGNSFKYEGDNVDLINDSLTIKETRQGAFLQLTVSPFSWIDIVAGGRYDYSSRYDIVFNPRTGAVIRPFEHTTFKLLYGTAFQAPSLFYQYEQFGTPVVTMLSTEEVQERYNQSWQLENQRVTSFEISIAQQIGENTHFQVSAYQNQLSDIIERVLFVTDNSAYNKYFNSYTNALRNENIGKQMIKGFDFSSNFRIASAMDVNLNYSYISAVSEIKDVETDLPRISNHKIWIGFNSKDFFDIVSFSLRAKWLSDITNINATAFPEGKQDGYYLVDLSVTLNNLVKYTDFKFNVQNLLNTEAFDGGLYGQSGVYLPQIPVTGLFVSGGVYFSLN